MESARTAGAGEVTLAEAAEQLGVHYMTAYRYVRLGELAAVQHGGRWWVEATTLADFAGRRARTGRAHGGSPAGAARTRRARRGPRVEQLSARLVAGDEPGAWQVVERALSTTRTPAAVYDTLLSPALRDIGDRWAAGSLSIADEHAATAVATRLVGRVGALCARPGRAAGTVVLAGAPGDRHALPTAMLADLLRSEGVRAVDLGADVPVANLVEAAAAQDRLVGVGICATTPVDDAAARVLAGAVRSLRRRTGRPVLVGGAGLVAPGVAARVGADHHSQDLAGAVEWFLSRIRTTPARRTRARHGHLEESA